MCLLISTTISMDFILKEGKERKTEEKKMNQRKEERKMKERKKERGCKEGKKLFFKSSVLMRWGGVWSYRIRVSLKQLYLIPRLDLKRVLSLRIQVNLRVMASKGSSRLS